MLVIVFLLILFNSKVYADDPPFKPGEIITYNIQQMGIKAGEATLVFNGPQKYSGQDTILITFTADGFNFYDQEKIYLHPILYKPLFVIRDLNIFGNKEKITEEYLSSVQKIKVRKEAGGKVTDLVLEHKSNIDNIYGFIYRYRLKGSFKTGDLLDVYLPTKDFKIELKKIIKISAGKKTYNSFFMQSNPSGYKLWFDVGPKKIPLRISGAIGIANSVMVMKEYKD